MAEDREEFARVGRLPPYVFHIVDELKMAARRRGEDIVDFGMGNPDQPPPRHVIEKLSEVSRRLDTHRYSTSRGILRLREAICQWYRRRYNVELDPETEAIVTMGSKEGLAHLAMAVADHGDVVLIPNPAYPIHCFGHVIAGADVRHVPIGSGSDFFAELEQAIHRCWPRPKLLLLNFPSNPTTLCVEAPFFEKVVEMAREYKIWVVQDLAYADLVFDGYQAPSILQAPGAREVAVEFFTMSKSYNMPGWRVGFMAGNRKLVHALARLKSYMDYGLFTPVQVAALAALQGPQDCVEQVREMYRKRRDVLCDGMNAAGWPVAKPRATMFVWARIPESCRALGSLEFAKKMLLQARVAVSPGVGFGECGEGYVRFSLIENAHRTRQAVRGIREMLRTDAGPRAVPLAGRG